jgi:hypothetical protein
VCAIRYLCFCPVRCDDIDTQKLKSNILRSLFRAIQKKGELTAESSGWGLQILRRRATGKETNKKGQGNKK